ncbi:SAM-dependent methyltransferase [Spongiactinospora gelatinilytica]|nr:SAM-dependent methyltransferase [Spongiactinospora gelatinilytica]
MRRVTARSVQPMDGHAVPPRSADHGGPPNMSRFDATVPNAARIYDYLLGGKNHFPADREAAAELLERSSHIRAGVRANRNFLERAVRECARRDYDQFIDLGSGLPTQQNVHQVVQAVNPDARVVYADNDLMAVTHGRALLNAPGVTMLQGDIRRPDEILNAPALTELIDLRRPVVVVAVAVLHFVSDREDPAGIIARLRARLAPGSRLVVSHACTDEASDEQIAEGHAIYARSSSPAAFRRSEDIAVILTTCTMEPPGLVPVSEWKPDPDIPAEDVGNAIFLGGIADLNAYGPLERG